MKYPLPLSIPKGFRPTISQPYGDKSKVDWYKANGLNLIAHNGVDITVGDPIQTYGTKIVCPVPNADLSQTWWDTPMSTKGNGIQISWEDDGRYNMRAWHCSKIYEKSAYKEQDLIGLIGNSGLVDPKPTPECPFCGAHIHLMVYKNGILVDPMTVFDINRWFISDDTGTEADLPPLFWVLEYAKNKLKELSTLLFMKRS